MALDSGKQMKAVLTKSASAITYENLMDFITSVEKGEARLYATHEEVPVDDFDEVDIVDL
jgi:hypothetical protein